MKTVTGTFKKFSFYQQVNSLKTSGARVDASYYIMETHVLYLSMWLKIGRFIGRHLPPYPLLSVLG